MVHSLGNRVLPPKRAGRRDREKKILITLVEYFLRTGKAVGSQVLQDVGFSDISSATIRNYFVSLEQEGYLKQQHTSGGRIPQSKAYVEYAKYCLDALEAEKETKAYPLGLKEVEATGIVALIQQAAENLSLKTKASIAISAPRFDHDTVTDLHYVFLDIHRALAVVLTEFGLVHTEVMNTPFTLTHSLLRKAERFARSRLFREPLEAELFEAEELSYVRKLYQEAMAAYFVRYSSISEEDVWRSGFSQLLKHPEFAETESLSASLTLFENIGVLRAFMRETMRSQKIRFWIGDQLIPYVTGEPNCALITIPYTIGPRAVGAIAVVGSMRTFYLELFRILRDAAAELSEILTSCFMHQKLSYRMPASNAVLTKEAYQMALEFHEPKRLL